MRRLTTGVDDAGRSCLVEVTDVVPTPPAEGGQGVNVARVHVEADRLSWLVVEHPGPTAVELHPSDALDLVFVHEGGGHLVLEDGTHEVTVGDLVVMPAVPHAMRGGPDGCTLVVVKARP